MSSILHIIKMVRIDVVRCRKFYIGWWPNKLWHLDWFFAWSWLSYQGNIEDLELLGHRHTYICDDLLLLKIYYHAFPLYFREIHDGFVSDLSDTTFWLVWYNLLIQTGSNSSKQTWFLVSWLQHSKLNWFELTGKGQMKYLSTGTQSKACYQWHNPNHLDCVTTTM